MHRQENKFLKNPKFLQRVTELSNLNRRINFIKTYFEWFMSCISVNTLNISD